VTGSGGGPSTRRSANAVSRRLSYLLRHAPHSVGLTLDTAGWVDVDEVVRTSDKQRFAFDDTGTRIRANQGHSVPVDLQLQPLAPPAMLYHGTVVGALEQILREGLTSRGRHHVHLSADVATARKVGSRRGKPAVLVVEAAAMAATGTPFYRSANGVWLVGAVPPSHLTRYAGDPDAS
jgi:putative RNA 2'-phosphotransferase